METILTTKGEIELSHLERIVGVEDRPTHLVLWVAYRLDGELVRQDAFQNPAPKELGPITATRLGDMPLSQLKRVVEIVDGPQDISIAEVYYAPGIVEHVKRSVWVIVKSPGVVAVGAVATLG